MPVDVVEMSTDEPDVAHQMITELYILERPVQYTSAAEPFEFTLRGMQAGEGVRSPTTVAIEASWPRLEVAVVRIPMGAVEPVAQARTGTGAADLRFDGMAPVSAVMARQWRALSGFVHQALDAPESMLEDPPLCTHLVEMLAATALSVFPNTTMTTQYIPEPGRVGPAALRRALAYIDAHAAQPITITDIAEAAGVTPRALQLAFRRHYEITPSGYLRRVRLEGAHRDLQAADPSTGATVGAIAAKWGFGPVSRFTSFYYQHVGVLPSHTLRT